MMLRQEETDAAAVDFFYEEEGDDGNVAIKRGTMERGLGILH
jgi:hypothetical protein